MDDNLIEKNKKYSHTLLVNEILCRIKEEHEAIVSYMCMVPYIDNTSIIEVIKGIADEEENHIDKLTKILNDLKTSNEKV